LPFSEIELSFNSTIHLDHIMRTAKEKARDAGLADMLVRAIERYFKREMKHVDDGEGRRMIRQDRKDLIHISSLVRRGHYIEARIEAENMDTLPREQIPMAVYDSIQKWG
jgi:hypothetical protein